MIQLPEIVATPDAEILAEVSETELRELTEEEADEVARRCKNWERVKEKLECMRELRGTLLDETAGLLDDALELMEADQ
jgi:hypothetical protein